MPIKSVACILFLAAACATEPPPTAEDSDALICGSFCDPNYDEPETLDMTFRYGSWAFPDSVPLRDAYGQPVASCADLGIPGHPEWQCIVSLITTANPCGTVAVSCFRGHCGSKALDGCH